MIFTLHRYIFRELLKVFGLATVALTLILSLGSILRPVQEYGVGPRQVIYLMGYFLPITLTFVLPVAALFAAALVYGRFAGDNELDACRASGISLLTLVYPGLILAIIVATANLLLSFHVMPAFVHRAVSSVKADAKQILFRNIERKGYYKLPPDEQYLIYADLAEPQNNTLGGVVVAETKNGLVEKIITAEKAEVQFSPNARFNEVQIRAYKTYQIGADQKAGFAEWLSLSTEFGSLLADEIKFKNIDQMKKIRDIDLMFFDPIAKLARQTFAQFVTELLAQDISTRLATEPRGFYRLYSGQCFVDFTAADCRARDEKSIELSEQVTATEYDLAGGRTLRTLRCAKAWLNVEGDETATTLTLELYNPVVKKSSGEEEPAWGWVRIRGLILPKAVETVVSRFKIESGLEVGKLVSDLPALQKGPSPILTGLQRKLERKIRSTLAEIEAETHSRLAFGVGCVPMILIGIGLGIILKGGHLLSAFGISCVPAAVLVVCILMGKNIAKNLGSQAISGTAMMWLGLGLLCVLAAAIYRKLLKN